MERSRRTQIRLCGGLVLELDGRRLEDALPSRQGRLLFAYLVLHRDRPATRDELVDALWPDRPPADPGASLSPILSKLRRVLGPEVLAGRHELRLLLPADAWIDVELAQKALAQAQRALASGEQAGAVAPAESALEVLEKGLLPGVDAPWLEQRRRELDESRLVALECLAAGGLAARPAQVAPTERAARNLIAAAPFRESGYRFLMETHERRGNVAEGLLVFELLRSLLRDEIGAVPGRASRRVHGRLLAQGEQPESVPGIARRSANLAPAPLRTRLPLPPALERACERPFVGREAPLHRLRAELREVRSGSRRFAALTGEPGIGKTVLAARLAREAHSDGVAVLYGRCDEEALSPYQPFVEMLSHHVECSPPQQLDRGTNLDIGELARIVPALGRYAAEQSVSRPDDHDSRLRLFESVVALLSQTAGDGPLVLVLDDLHWADPDTLLLLRHLMRSAALERLLVIGTFRDAEIAPGEPLADRLTEVRREGSLERIGLSGLGEDETLALVSSAGGGEVPTGFARRLRELTAGNPFFIEEALRRLRDAASAAGEPVVFSEATLRRLGVPEGAREVIEQRLSRLDFEVREVLTLAAVIGQRFDRRVLQAAATLSGEQVISALEGAVARGLVRESSDKLDSFSFAHSLVRDALYRSLTASGRERLHQRAGEALEACTGGTAFEELAHHFFEARHVVDPERAIRYARQASERATASTAYEVAARHLERALAAAALRAPPDPGERCELLLALGEAHLRAGETRARDTFREAAVLARQEADGEYLARAAIGFGGRYYEAGVVDQELTALLEESLAVLPESDSVVRSRLLARLGEALHFAGEPHRADTLGAAALGMAQRLGDIDALAGALAGRHVTLLHIDHLEERLAVSEKLIELARAQGRAEPEVHARHARLYDLHELGDLAAARAEGARLADLADELRQPLYRHFALSWRGVWAQLEGHFEEAERIAGELLAIQQDLGARDAQSVFAARLFNIRRDQGRVHELVPGVEAFIEQFPAFAPWRAALPLVLAESGEEERARAELGRFGTDEFRDVPRNFFWLTAIAALAEASALLEHPEHSAALYESLSPYSERNVQIGFAACLGPVARYLGLLAGVLGWRDRAVMHFRQAEAAAEALDSPTIRARVASDHARTLVRIGEPEAARAPIQRALETARRLGMDGLLTRLERGAARGPERSNADRVGSTG